MHPGSIYKTDLLSPYLGECLIRLQPEFPKQVAIAHLYLGLTTNEEITLATRACLSLSWRYKLRMLTEIDGCSALLSPRARVLLRVPCDAARAVRSCWSRERAVSKKAGITYASSLPQCLRLSGIKLPRPKGHA